MGTFDEITFAKNFKKLPESMPKTGWQTKDLDCDMSRYHIQNDGLLIRKGSQAVFLQGKRHQHTVNLNLSTHTIIYTDEFEVLIEIENGYVTDVKAQWQPTNEPDNWEAWSGQLDD